MHVNYRNVEDDSDLPPGPAHSYLSSLNYDDVDEVYCNENSLCILSKYL